MTRIDPDGTVECRVVDTAARSDAGPGRNSSHTPWLPGRPTGRFPESGLPSRIDDRAVLVAEHDLSRPLSDLVTAVLAIGEAAAD